MPDGQAGQDGQAPQEGAVPPCLANIELKYSTWGSYGQHTLTTILLPTSDNQLYEVDVTRVTPYNRGSKATKTVSVAGYTITFHGENTDSRKNTHRRAWIISINPMPPFIIIKNEYQSSRNRSVDYTVLNPKTCEERQAEIHTEEYEREEIKEDDKRTRVYRVIDIYEYIIYNGEKYLLRKRSERQLIQETLKYLEIFIEKRKNGEILVYGDTYPIRQALKALGFRWSSLKGAWVPKRPGRAPPVEEIKEAVEEAARQELGIHAVVEVRE